MNALTYWILASVISLALAAALVWTRARTARNQFVLTAVASAVVLLLLGYVDWRTQSPVETPMSTYVLIAILPVFGTAAVVAVLAERKARPAIQYPVAVATSLLLIAASLLSSFFP